MICAAQSTFDYFKDSKDFFTLIQYAAKVSKVFAASRAPEHFGVHLSEKTALPKAINMRMNLKAGLVLLNQLKTLDYYFC